MNVKKFILFTVLLPLIMTTSVGCKLVFEPSSDAVSRLFASMPTGETRVVRELCDGEDVCNKLITLSGIVRSDWYHASKGFYNVKSIEVAADTGRAYVHVDLILPTRSIGRDTPMELIFEMERIKLRWHIYKVTGIEEFIRRAERERGILVTL